jgi:transposase
MRQKSERVKDPVEKVVKDIRRATGRSFSAEQKILVVSRDLRGKDSIIELCLRKRIAQSLYYNWSEEFLEAGKVVWHASLKSTTPLTDRPRQWPVCSLGSNRLFALDLRLNLWQGGTDLSKNIM